MAGTYTETDIWQDENIPTGKALAEIHVRTRKQGHLTNEERERVLGRHKKKTSAREDDLLYNVLPLLFSQR